MGTTFYDGPTYALVGGRKEGSFALAAPAPPAEAGADPTNVVLVAGGDPGTGDPSRHTALARANPNLLRLVIDGDDLFVASIPPTGECDASSAYLARLPRLLVP